MYILILYFGLCHPSSQLYNISFSLLSRIQKFFELPELSYYDAKVHVPNSRISDPKAAIVLEKVCCDWNSDGSDSVQNIDECESPGCKRDSDNPLMAALININLNFKMNSLTCIIGSVGSGENCNIIYNKCTCPEL